MKKIVFKEKSERWSKSVWKGRKNGFSFQIAQSTYGGYYVLATKKEIRYNTLWEQITFPDLQTAEEWCNNFDYTKYKCLGTDTV